MISENRSNTEREGSPGLNNVELSRSETAARFNRSAERLSLAPPMNNASTVEFPKIRLCYHKHWLIGRADGKERVRQGASDQEHLFESVEPNRRAHVVLRERIYERLIHGPCSVSDNRRNYR